MLIVKNTAGTAGPYTWDHAGQAVDVDDVTARGLLSHSDFHEVALGSVPTSASPVVDDQPVDLSTLDKADLVALARVRGLPTSGTMKDLRARITDSMTPDSQVRSLIVSE